MEWLDRNERQKQVGTNGAGQETGADAAGGLAQAGPGPERGVGPVHPDELARTVSGEGGTLWNEPERFYEGR